MRIGILADIHGDVPQLTKAIERLQAEQVDPYVLLGDVIYQRKNSAETVSLLENIEAVGVWGNHDLGLCVDPSEDLQRTYAQPVVQFFQTLEATYELGEFLFSHSLPDQEAADPCSYYLGPHPHEDQALTGCFAQFPHRVFLVGHFHRWFAATPSGTLPWDGSKELILDPTERYFLVIHAVLNGWTAVLDDQLNTLQPISF